MQTPVKKLETRYYKTYKARLELQKRLDRHRVTWNWFLVVSSLSTLIVSILSLTSASDHTTYTDIITITLSLCTFTGSLVLTSLRLPERSKDAFRAYRAIQALSSRLETASDAGVEISKMELNSIRAEYDQIMDATENHSELDYLASRGFEKSSKIESCLKRAAYRIQSDWPAWALVPIVVLTGIAVWQVFPLA